MIFFSASTLQSHEIHNLDTYTQYLVSLQVFNPEGPGPATTVLVMTDEGGKCDSNALHRIEFSFKLNAIRGLFNAKKRDSRLLSVCTKFLCTLKPFKCKIVLNC